MPDGITPSPTLPPPRHVVRLSMLCLFALSLASAGCGSPPAKVKGRLVSDGQPMSVSGQVAVTFTATAPDDKGRARTINAVVNGDGSFEAVESGGEVPPGTYQVSIVAVDKAAKQFKHAAMLSDKSPIRRELKPGPNEVVIDVAKPEG